MMKRSVLLSALLYILVITVLIAPVTGLAVVEGAKIIAPNESTSLEIIVDYGLAQDGNITIDVTGLNTFVASGTFTTDNIVLDSAAVAAGWTAEVADSNLILTSAGRAIDAGETFKIAFTGTGNPWIAYTGGVQTVILTATIPETFETSNPFNFVIQTGGLSITNGEKITTTGGSTLPVITITDSPILENDAITIDVSNLSWNVIASGAFTPANVMIEDTAAAATWTGEVEDNTLTLTSTGGPTLEGENITVTLTGTGNPWIDNTGGAQIYPLTVTRSDGLGESSIEFAIETGSLGGLSVTDGAEITATDGETSPVITITGSDIPLDGTITIDVSMLHQYVGSGNLTNANVVIEDTAAAATWTGEVEDNTLTLTSTGGPTAVGENITVTFTGAQGNPWVADSGGQYLVPLTATRTDINGQVSFNFVINTVPLGSLTVADGMKITTIDGATSALITVTNTDIARDGTITINVTSLNSFVAGGQVTNANVVIEDTAAAATWTGVVAGNILTLTSTAGTTAAGETVTVTFTGAAGRPWVADTGTEKTLEMKATRTDTSQSGTFYFVINTGGPVADFTALPLSEIAPATITFTDTSIRSPTSWNWSFGDGSTSAERNPVHLYTSVGKYTVNLTVTNARGSSNKLRTDYINVLNGVIRVADTSITGLTITNCGGPQTVTVDTSVLPSALIPNNSVLEIQPPTDRGFKNITIYALDGIGFSRNGNQITGNPTRVHLVSEEIAPLSGFSSDIGTDASFNFSIDLPSYPCNAILNTKIWEGVIQEYDTKFRQTASGNNAFPIGTAYTATITKTNFPSSEPVTLHMNVNSTWNPSLPGGPGTVFIWRISDDGTQGQILPTDYLYTNPVNNLDYYEAESPLGLSTFGLSSLTGNNNPFQMITLILSEIINPPDLSSSDSNDISLPVSVVTQNATSTTISLIPLDPGKTAKIYANEQGVITQATTLQSTDGFATVNLGTGVVARDAEGKPLSSITIRAIPSENLPGTSPGASISFTGRAYELQPDGATFTPGISISFTAPAAQFGQNLMVKMYDSATDTWIEVPSSTNPETGIVTAYISHFCCLALFAEEVTPEPASANPPPTPQLTAKVVAPAPTAMSTFVGMILWVADLIQKNIIIFAGLGIIAISIFLYGRKRRRDRLMYLF